MQPVPAKVITQVQDELTINQGQESGVAVGQYVMSLTDARLDDQCVIGSSRASTPRERRSSSSPTPLAYPGQHRRV